MSWQSWHDTRPSMPPSARVNQLHACIDDITTGSSVDRLATWVIDVLGLFLDMISMGVCTPRNWQISSRLVQEVYVSTVCEIQWSMNHRNEIRLLGRNSLTFTNRPKPSFFSMSAKKPWIALHKATNYEARKISYR